MGSLLRYLQNASPKNFQPMNFHFGLLDELEEKIRDRQKKRMHLAQRALCAMQKWKEELPVKVAGKADPAL
jgi:methylenetetrahydrofolate--tRNA-(uracil-5-)-methyltransferase